MITEVICHWKILLPTLSFRLRYGHVLHFRFVQTLVILLAPIVGCRCNQLSTQELMKWEWKYSSATKKKSGLSAHNESGTIMDPTTTHYGRNSYAVIIGSKSPCLICPSRWESEWESLRTGYQYTKEEKMTIGKYEEKTQEHSTLRGFEVIMAVNIRITIFCDVTPCSPVATHVSKKYTPPRTGKVWTFRLNLRPPSSGYPDDTADVSEPVCQLHSVTYPTTILKHSTWRWTRTIGGKCLRYHLFELELLRLRKGHFSPLTNRFKNSLKLAWCNESSVISLFRISNFILYSVFCRQDYFNIPDEKTTCWAIITERRQQFWFELSV
jgi:hypothetical protein